MRSLTSSCSYTYFAYTLCDFKAIFLVYFLPPPPPPLVVLELFLMASWYTCYFLHEQCPALHSGAMGGRVRTWLRGWACHAALCALSPPCCAAAESMEQFPQYCPEQTAWFAQAQSSNPYISNRLETYLAEAKALATVQNTLA